ncbi:pregnancy zone protein-like [Hypomesus transpacificus]|uniref:pregnancy zone protein-like n=1 Tax=Hypomesus transpacificus TaxID=137520 RepID=UPI001F08813E|nr:pregnancy zone protein-like [Hypomesus transpacificus]
MAGSVMDLIKVEVWRWMLLASLLSMCVSQEATTPAYMVAVPAILPAGSEAKLCASLLQPNETLVMTISLQSQGESLKLFQETSDKEFHRCFEFQVPQVQKDMVPNIKVEVRGDTFSSTELRKVMIRPSSSMTFVQTDKPIYKPGQKVHFRVVSLDTSFRPASQLYEIIELQDVNSNRIGQWVNTTSNGKILQLSHPLSSEAPKGSYSIVVSTGGNKVYHSFKVEHYVLPKFDIKLTMEEEISVVQEEFKVKLCAMYTYGQPVPGTAEVELCRPLERHYYVPVLITPDNPEGVPEFIAPCHKETVQFDKTGCASLVFNMAIFTKAGDKPVAQHLLLSVKAEEEGTGVSQFQNKRINLSNVIGRYSFIETPKIYEHGTIVMGKVKVVHFNNTPIADQAVYLSEGEGWSPRLLHNLTTDRDGIASFTLNTTNSPKQDIKLIANAKPQGEFNTYRSPYFVNGEHTLSVIRPIPAESKTISFLDIQKKDDPLPCGEEEQIKVQYTVVGETVAGGFLDLMYLVLARGAIVQQGVMKAKVQNGPVSDGEVTFKLAVSPDMAPLVQVLVYAVLPSESVIANSIDFPTQKCFNNMVSLQFSPSRAVPGEESSLHLSAQPGSLCGLSAVDQSVLIMEPEGRLNVDKIFQMLPFTKAEAVSYELEDQTGCLHVRPKRYVYPSYREEEVDAYSVFQKLGLKMATNLIMRVPSCIKFKGRDYHHNYVVSYRDSSEFDIRPVALGMEGPGPGAAPPPPPIQTVRTFFPETWIWDLVEVGASGSEDVALTVPDTITTWETEVFCLSSEGLGLAPPLELNVFQPFFLELSLPYSIIRGELLELTATVFNYLPSCIMVSVNPATSLDYTLTPITGVEYSSCLCANGRNTFRWTMTPLVLGALNVSVSAEAVASHASCDNEIVSVPERGRIDVVTRSLLVKAEGTEQTDTYNWLLCPAGESLKEEVDIKLPQEVIDGSARASLSVLGDILGRAMQNLDGLLRMPYGCGEQNMALLAPNIYILEYLRNTEQLTTAILDKAKGFLTSGYQRQLNYKHYDGAYSTFGQGAGNTWLTAFVLRAFGRAKSFIYIDPQVIEISKLWLENRQEPDGSFMRMGKLFNNRMKGGVSDEVTFTAYVTASLLELNNSVSDPIVAKSLSYLRAGVPQLPLYIYSRPGLCLKHCQVVGTPAEPLWRLRFHTGETPKIYEHGTIVMGKVKVVHFNNTPIADQAVYLSEGEGWSPRLLHNLTTDRDGIASFTLNTTNSPKQDIKLIANAKPQGEFNTYRSPYFVNGEHTLSVIRPIPAESKTISFLDIQKKDDPLPCGEEEQIKVQYTVVGETVAGGFLDLMYLVLARGAIVQQGVMKAKVQNGPVSDGEVTFKLAVSPDMAPLVQVLVYAVLPSESVIANSIDFPTQKCFNNMVSLQFSPSRAVPGEESSLHLSAQPGSLCGLSAVDQSVLIMEPEGRLNVDKIFQMLPFTKAEAVSYELEDQTGCLHVRPKRYVYPSYREEEVDAYSVFQKLGLKMATNLIMRVPSCLKFKGRDYHRGYVVSYRQHTPMHGVAFSQIGMAGPGPGAAPPPPPIQTVRTFFPETWIWDLVEVGASGSEDVALTVPDTITTWETEVFCLSSEGLGLAPPLELNVFQPFFLELSLPYSIIRGELLELTATVFNYLPSCIMVSVNPATSLDYTLTPITGVEYSSCLCANGRNTFRWTMTPLVLGALNVSVSAEAVASHASCDNEIVSVPERGRIDVVTRSLLVKAEGTEQTDTYNWLLCPAGESLKEEVDIKLPQEVIDGSARASLSVLGDILGRAMQNLDGLLRMPYGCGEQNMALLAPNIYILEYLRNTEQLTTAILDKAKGFLTSGYQRQLNYKHYDGAYSTFGQGAGNTWLTAFVLRAFGRAKSFIYIDPQVIEISKLWLENRQEPDGSFMRMGKLFNNRMKGGVSDEVTFTAYVTASLLELNNSVSDPIVAKSLSYLRNSSMDVSNTYTTALLAYTFSLAGDMETRSRLLQYLDKVASHQGGFLYWSQSSSTTSASLSVEISSYVLLASLSSPSISTADLGYASNIVRWLVRQQNPYGGFASTQDTVVALQALALYSTKVFSPEGSSSVSVQSPGGEVQVFHIDQSNKLLYQEKALPAQAGQYSIEVKGTACATVQVAVHYNVPTPTDSSTLKIQVVPEINCSSNALRPRLSLKLQSLYSGKEQTTNMVIVDLKMLSGFVPDPQSLTQLKTALLVDRVETKDDHVLMYLRELISGVPIYHSLDIIQELPVQKLKPAVVQIYDYYQPSDQAETEYIYPCAADV